MKNPQTRNAPTYLTHIISAIGGVYYGRQIQIVGYIMQNKTLENAGAGRCYYQMKI